MHRTVKKMPQLLMENVEMRTEPLATKGEVISNELL